MEKLSRRKFTTEFKAETVALIRRSGKSIAEVCREMGLPESSVHRWLAQADMDSGQRDGLTTAEREELSRLKRELRVVREPGHRPTSGSPTRSRPSSTPAGARTERHVSTPSCRLHGRCCGSGRHR
jgi:transposase